MQTRVSLLSIVNSVKRFMMMDIMGVVLYVPMALYTTRYGFLGTKVLTITIRKSDGTPFKGIAAIKGQNARHP